MDPLMASALVIGALAFLSGLWTLKKLHSRGTALSRARMWQLAGIMAVVVFVFLDAAVPATAPSYLHAVPYVFGVAGLAAFWAGYIMVKRNTRRPR
jgi:hypothetical protein